jgi:hypothetical protein
MVGISSCKEKEFSTSELGQNMDKIASYKENSVGSYNR